MVWYQREKPPIVSIKNGTTVLTNKRIIFLKSRLGETRYEKMDKVEKDLQNKESFYIKREKITGVYADTRVRVPYLILEYRDNGETQIASFAALDYNAIINLVLLFKRELVEKDPSYALVKSVDSRLDRLSAIPMMICWGAHDFVFDNDYLKQWQKRFPHAEVHYFKNAGHYVLEDEPEAIISRIRDFLKRHPI